MSDTEIQLVDPIEGSGPMEGSGPTPWDDADWRTGFLDWIRSSVPDLAVTAERPIDVRVRAWSIVAAVPREDGTRVWAKANPPGAAFEGPLLALLAERAPHHVLTPLAVERTLGWFLLPDGGEMNERPVPDEPPGAHLHQPYRRYADLQQTASGLVSELRAIGVPDLRPSAIPAVVDGLLDRVPVPEVAARRGEIADWCAELAESPIASSLDHADLHEHQMFRDPSGGDAWRFFDWGTAAVAHPFASLLFPRSYYAAHLDAVAAFDAAYLSVWPGDPVALARAADLAARLARVGTATMRDRNFVGAWPREAVDEWIAGCLLWLVAED
jgi:hypothetical protein